MFRSWLCLLEVLTFLFKGFLVKLISFFFVFSKRNVLSLQIWFLWSDCQLFDVLGERVRCVFCLKDGTESFLLLLLKFRRIWNIVGWCIDDNCVQTCRRCWVGQRSFCGSDSAVALLQRILLQKKIHKISFKTIDQADVGTEQFSINRLEEFDKTESWPETLLDKNNYLVK